MLLHTELSESLNKLNEPKVYYDCNSIAIALYSNRNYLNSSKPLDKERVTQRVLLAAVLIWVIACAMIFELLLIFSQLYG